MPCLFFFGAVAMAALYFLFCWSGGFCCPVFCLLGTVALDSTLFLFVESPLRAYFWSGWSGGSWSVFVGFELFWFGSSARGP